MDNTVGGRTAAPCIEDVDIDVGRDGVNRLNNDHHLMTTEQGCRRLAAELTQPIEPAHGLNSGREIPEDLQSPTSDL